MKLSSSVLYSPAKHLKMEFHKMYGGWPEYGSA